MNAAVILNRRMNVIQRFLVCLTILTLAWPVAAQTKADRAAIRAAALDYIEGWYGSDAARMERAVHPDLAKRRVRKGDHGESVLSSMTAAELIEHTRRPRPSDTPKQKNDVKILDVDGDMASVKIVSAQYVDYVHLIRWNGAWKIINVLWDFRPAAASKKH